MHKAPIRGRRLGKYTARSCFGDETDTLLWNSYVMQVLELEPKLERSFFEAVNVREKCENEWSGMYNE